MEWAPADENTLNSDGQNIGPFKILVGPSPTDVTTRSVLNLLF